MAYNKTAWTDRVVEKPLTFTLQDNGDGTTTLIPSEGNIIQAGTPITSANLNKLETQYEQVFVDIANYQELKVTDDNGETIDKGATDPNALSVTGWYEFSSTAPNMPVAGFGWIIEHMQASTTVAYQTAFQISVANRMFYRRKSAGTWEAWREVARLDQVLPLTGGQLSGALTILNGITTNPSSLTHRIFLKSGQKNWTLQHGGGGELNFYPSASVDGTDWVAGNVIAFYPTGNLRANAFQEGGTLLSSKYFQLSGGTITGNTTITKSTTKTEFKIGNSADNGMINIHTDVGINKITSVDNGYTVFKDLQITAKDITFDVTTLKTNKPETGFCGIGAFTPIATTTSIAGVGVNFRLKKTYTPSSITLTAMSNTATALTTQINVDGFWLYINGTNLADAYLYWRGTYTA